MTDKWLIFCITQFISAFLGFLWGFIMHTIIFMYVGGFFFSLGTFAITRWGYDRWKAKQKPRRRK
ncbi:MAG TPA: hypothetical protein VEJ68_04585 [Candidatus Bathyarchaeia archaeon]|nr:hypothetical protein [Candidatus Bathyarchaeia archaeon]